MKDLGHGMRIFEPRPRLLRIPPCDGDSEIMYIADTAGNLDDLAARILAMIDRAVAKAKAERDAAAAAAARAESAESSLLSLLALIHGDGGHHTKSVGVGQSVEDAGKRWAVLVTAERELAELRSENERLRERVLSAAGDDLCRLTQDEIKSLTSGKVQIPPEEEFIASCRRFHSQIADESGVLPNCLTLAQMIAENERLRVELKSKGTTC